MPRKCRLSVDTVSTAVAEGYDIKEMATLFCVAEGTLYNFIRNHNIPNPNGRRTKREEVDELLLKNATYAHRDMSTPKVVIGGKTYFDISNLLTE